MPTSIEVIADGAPVATIDIVGADPVDGMRSTTLGLPRPITASTIELRFPGVETRRTTNWYGGGALVLPISIADVDIAGLRVAPIAEQIDTGCRDDLLQVDGIAVPVQITGTTTGALDGRAMTLQSCGSEVVLDGGQHEFRATPGGRTGLDLDQLVWRSDPVDGGADATVDPTPAAPPTVEVTSPGDTSVGMRVSDAQPGEPFWLVFGQSFNSGWVALDNAAEVDGPHLVDGYANGYLVTPGEADFDLTLRFVPQNRVDVGLLVSVVGVAGAALLALSRPRPLRPASIPRQEPLRRIRALSYEGALPVRRKAIVVGVVGLVMGLAVTNPLIAVLLGAVGFLSTRREGWRPLLTVAPAVLLAGVAAYVVLLQARDRIVPGLEWPAIIEPSPHHRGCRRAPPRPRCGDRADLAPGQPPGLTGWATRPLWVTIGT